MIEHFQYKGHICLVLEMLDVSVDDYVRNNGPLRLSEIQMVTRQLLVALRGLKSIGVVHADIKPDNIMLVNHQFHPFKVKVTDFGISHPLWFLQGCLSRKMQELTGAQKSSWALT